VVALVAAIGLLVVPLVATAGSRSVRPSLSHNFRVSRHTFVAPGLLSVARLHPNKLVHVIIQSSDGTNAATSAFERVDRMDGGMDREGLHRRLRLVDGVSVQIEAKKLAALRKLKGLTVTPDAPVKLDGLVYSTQLWPYAQGFAPLWGNLTGAPQAPTIAVVDSGIDAGRSDFGGRVITNVNLTTLPNNSLGDGRGHGTMVAGLAAGSAAGYAGAAPNAKIVSLDIMDDSGMARTSDVITAAGWILANKDKYGIRVANFSLHSTTPSNFTRDPLDRAVEKLWFNNVVVVAAAGNYGSSAGPSGVRYAPGNDPFVITVGGTDLGGTLSPSDDSIAPWSAYGYTYDGFWKPEISASGRYIVGPVPPSATLYSERPDHVVSAGYMQLSGTSFAAPIVAGATAQLLARRPGLTPDQVKGALMASALSLPRDTQFAGGVGEVNASRAVLRTTIPNPNRALDQYLATDPADGSKAFNAVAWQDAAKASVAWDDVAWQDVAWQDISWAEVAWGDIAWGDIAWGDVAWQDVAWEDVAWQDAAEADGTSDAAGLTPKQLTAAKSGQLDNR
jgi:serine protease AprX